MFPSVVGQTGGGGYGWIGLWVVAGLLCGGFCAMQAIRRGRRPGTWFAVGFVTLGVGVVLVLLLRPGREALNLAGRTAPPVICACGHENHPAAHRCLHCGAALIPRTRAETDHA